MTTIESFEVDHTELKAPRIRIAKQIDKGSFEVIKYDLRFVTPNTTYFDDKTMHSMEHLLAVSFKKEFGDDMIDLSPMGCKTGFYFTAFRCTEIYERIKKAIISAIDIEIPVPTEKNCGSYLLHNVEGARCALRAIAKQLL